MEWIFLLGAATGLRSMTPIAVVCWFCWMGRLPVHHTWAFWAANIISAIVFTVFALGEYVADTQPKTPNRTALGPALARVVFGGLVGSILATSYMEPVAGGALFGAVGALVGTWGGFYARRAISKWAGRDLPVALLESVLALGLAIFAAHRYAAGIAEHPATFVALHSL